MFRFTGNRVARLGQIQWAPTLKIHDPNPPITLENPAVTVRRQIPGIVKLQAVNRGNL